MSNFGEVKNSTHFRAVDVNLEDFYQDHRSKARIFINDKIDYVKQFERRIAEVFNVSDFYLSCNGHYLPPSEDIRIIKAGEVVRVVALKQETRRKQRKRDKERVLPVEIEDDNTGGETAVAVKERKKHKNRENDQTPADLEELNDLPLDEEADNCDDKEKTQKKKKKKRKHSKDVEAEEPKAKKMKADREQPIADDVQVASKKKLRKSENSEPDKQPAKTKDCVGDSSEQGECSVKRKKKNKCRETSEHMNEEGPIETISPSARTANNSFDQYMEVPINTDLPQRKVNIVKTIIVSSGTIIDTSIAQIQQNKDKAVETNNDSSAALQSAVEFEFVPEKSENLSAENCGSLAKRKRNRTRKRKQKNFGRCPPPTPPAASSEVMWPNRVVRPMIGPVRPEGRHIKFTEDDNVQEISSESGNSETGSRATTPFQRTQDPATKNNEIMTKAVKNEILEQSQLQLQNNGCTALVVDKTECNGDKQNGIVDAADVNSQSNKSESLSAADAKIQFDKAESDMEIDSIVADIHKFNRTADEMDKAGVPKGTVAGGQPVSAEESTSTRTNGHLNVNKTDTVAENTAKNGNLKDAGVGLGISNNFPEITEELISKSPISSDYVPGVTDVIAFKILRISEQYTPEVSSYIAGQIINYDASREVITLNISYGFDQCTPPQGKFSINKEDSTGSMKDKTVEFTWPELLEIRRLSPRC